MKSLLMNEVFMLGLSDNRRHPYQLINSKRAKYIRIKLSDRGELSVVVPRGTASKHAHKFVQTKAGWVEKHLQKVVSCDKPFAPESLNLKLLGELWSIEYVATNSNNLSLTELSGSRLLIVGDTRNPELLKKVINLWCKKKAKPVFTEMLQQLAEEHGFHYQRLSIRAQKTRWGSCSDKKNINLNCKLLLMPEDIVKYVMIHELCHTLEMNHSNNFWSLVEGCDPHHKNNRQQLKMLGKEIVL